MEEKKPETQHFFTAFDAVMVLVLVFGTVGFLIYRFIHPAFIVNSIPELLTTAEQANETATAHSRLTNDLDEANLLIEKQEYPAARQLLNNILAQTKADFPDDFYLVGRTLTALSKVALKEDDLPLATDWANQAVAFYERVTETNYSEIWNLEAARQQRIEVSKARNDHDALIVDYQALTDFYRQLDGDQPSKSLATNLQSLALEYLALDDYTQAESHYLDALTIAQKLWEPDSVTLAVMANDLGVIYKNLNKLTEAKTYYEQSLATWEKLQPAEKNNLATALENYAFVLNELNDPATAATYDRAQTLKKEIADEAQP